MFWKTFGYMLRVGWHMVTHQHKLMGKKDVGDMTWCRNRKTNSVTIGVIPIGKSLDDAIMLKNITNDEFARLTACTSNIEFISACDKIVYNRMWYEQNFGRSK